MIEFTGERVVPGQVEPDLYNEHLARYLFAARLARGKRVADLGCGTGYGSAELARTAAEAAGFDASEEAIAYASDVYLRSALSLRFAKALCEEIPEADGSFDLVVAFEVIEHLADAERLLQEAKRLMAAGGQFAVSTPNKAYYEASRSESGPNPFHTREFTLDEFRELLRRYFPHVTLFTQNHSSALVIRPLGNGSGQPVVRIEEGGAAETAHFYIAVCAMTPQIGSPTFLYLPTAANVLREREVHIARLREELAMKQQWWDKEVAEHAELLAQYRAQSAELETVNDWLTKRDREIAEKIAHVDVLQRDLKEASALAEVLGARSANLEADLAVRSEELARKVEELGRAVELLHASEGEVETRTAWAQSLEKENAALRERLDAAAASRWMKLGRKLNVGPDLKS